MRSVQNVAVDFDAASATDRWIEAACENTDLLAGDPATWPAFLDQDRWTLGPDQPDDADELPALEEPAPGLDDEWPAYEPEDAAWAASQELADQVDDAHATSVWLERLEQSHRYTDADIAASGLAIG